HHPVVVRGTRQQLDRGLGFLHVTFDAAASSVSTNTPVAGMPHRRGERGTRPCATMRAPPRDTITQLAECLLRRADPYPGLGAHQFTRPRTCMNADGLD